MLGLSFNLAPATAIEFFKAKGLKTTFAWQDMLGEEHDAAFTVAKMMDIDLLGEVRERVDRAIAEGVSRQDFRRELEGVLRAKGWWGTAPLTDPLTGQRIDAQLGSAHRLNTIYRTNVRNAYAVGHWEQIAANKDSAPYVIYDAVDDHRTRPEHARLDNRVVHVDDSWLDTHYPPNGWNSLVPDQRVSASAYLGLKAWYTGEVVEVRGHSGGGFAVTAQHPVLTRRGWVAAGALVQGDELVGYGGEVGGGAMTRDHHENHPPPTIEQAFQALASGARCAVPRAALNLHGEARFLHGNVDVVGVDRALVEHLHATAVQFAAEFELLRPALATACGARLSPGDAVNGLGGRHGRRLGRPGALSASAVLAANGGGAIQGDALSAQIRRYLLAAFAKARANVAQRQPAAVQLDHLWWHWLSQVGALAAFALGAREPRRLRFGALGHTALAQVFIGGADADTDALRRIVDAHPRAVRFDQVVDTRRRQYSGHVYDLQTDSGNILAYGGEKAPHYVLSNCRCSMIQVTAGQLEELGLAPTGAPTVTTAPWTNPRTGKRYQVPTDLDPGWDHNPGKARLDTLAALAAEKAAALEGDLAATAKAALDKRAVAKAAKEAASAQAAAELARAKAKVAERAAQWQIDEALAANTAYLAPALKALAKQKASADLSASQLLAKAKARAAEAETSAALSHYKQALLAGKTPSAKAQAAYSSLSEADKTAINAQLAAAAAKAAAQEKIAAIAAGEAKLTQTKALKALQSSGEAEGLGPVALAAKVDEMAAELQAKASAAAAVSGYKKKLSAGLLPTPAQTQAFNALSEAKQAQVLADIDAAKAKAAKAAPSEGGAQETTAPGGIHLEALTQIGPQKGSNPGALYLDTETGVSWYIKRPANGDLARNEVLAARLYAAAGIDVPELALITHKGQPAVASRIVEGVERGGAAANWAKIDGAHQGFAVDAWLANWDVVGLDYDNLLVRAGQAWRVDTGGALLYRAQGEPKAGAFTPTVGELTTLRDAATNRQAATVFKGVTQADLEAGAARVAAVPEATIRALVAELGPGDAKTRAWLAETLIKRQRDIAKRFPGQTKAAKEAQQAAVDSATAQLTADIAALDENVRAAIKGVSSQATVRAKDIERVSRVRETFATLMERHGDKLTDEGHRALSAFYSDVLDDLARAVAPGEGNAGAWAGGWFEGWSAAVPIDPARIAFSLPKPGEREFDDTSGHAAIEAAFGASAREYPIRRSAGAERFDELSEAHRRAIAMYTGSYYRPLNAALREGSAADKARYRPFVRLLSEALAAQPYKGNSVRGVKLKAAERAKLDKAYETGTSWHDPAFLSADRRRAFAGNVQLHLKARSGSHVRPISTNATAEDEVLFAPGTRWKVVDRKEKTNAWHYWLVEI